MTIGIIGTSSIFPSNRADRENLFCSLKFSSTQGLSGDTAENLKKLHFLGSFDTFD